jgi:hypothetical protein
MQMTVTCRQARAAEAEEAALRATKAGDWAVTDDQSAHLGRLRSAAGTCKRLKLSRIRLTQGTAVGTREG